MFEVNLIEIIDRYKNDRHTTLAHCKSADLYDVKSMSVVLAVSDSECFGKPLTSELHHSNLAYQESINDGSGVYSLITKLNTI